MVVMDAIQSVLSVVVMISLGYILSIKGWFDEKTSKLFSKLVVNISLPAMMLSNLLTTFDKSKLVHSGVGLVIPFVSIIVSYGAGIILSKLLKISAKRQGTFQVMFAFANTVFIGLPVNISLFGEGSAPFVFLYYFANTSLFWIIGTYGIRKDSGIKSGKIISSDTLKHILSPPLIAFIVSVILILLEIQLPKFIMDSSKYIGNLTTPMSMLFIGMIIYSIGLRNLKFDRDAAALFVGRFILAPLLIFILLRPFPVPDLMKKVFVIQSAMPILTQSAIITQAYNADYKYAAKMVTISTIAGLIFIPIYMFLLSVL